MTIYMLDRERLLRRVTKERNELRREVERLRKLWRETTAELQQVQIHCAHKEQLIQVLDGQWESSRQEVDTLKKLCRARGYWHPSLSSDGPDVA